MKKAYLLLSIIFLFVSANANAQIGIGTTTPDASAVLDLSSTTKGLLMPRMTTLQQTNLVSPAIGLSIFNTTTGQIETNKGNGLGGALWVGDLNTGTTATLGDNSTLLATTEFVLSNSGHYNSVNAAGTATTTSATVAVVDGMTISPEAGTYLVSFNSEYTNTPTVILGTTTTTTTGFNTGQGVIDLAAAYNVLIAIPVTNATHTITFGSGEILLPGVYSTSAALSVAGVLTLDGGGNSNALFILRSVGAINTAAGTSIVLTNGASASNIFWIAEGAAAIGAGTIMKGTLLAHGGAVAMGAGGDLVGHMFSTGGAIAFGPGTAITSPISSYVDFGVLNSFIIFTSAGALGGTGISHITGNLATDFGLITGFDTAIIDGSIYEPGVGTITNTVTTPPITASNATTTFGVYQNGNLIANSSKIKNAALNATDISLQAIATVAAGQPIDIRWKVETGTTTLANRILTIIKVR
ncbi:Ice-binding protein [Flavobacteriaceae bacterium]